MEIYGPLTFLKNHPLKHEEVDLGTHWWFSYSFRADSILSSAIVVIPKSEGNGEFAWAFREIDEGSKEVLNLSQSDKCRISDLASGWFRDLISETEAVVFRRDRLRILFRGERK